MQEATLTISCQQTGRKLSVRVRQNANFLEISPDGYGENEADDGQGSPILLDLFDGKLKVQLFKDINDPGPETVSMEKARESLRQN